MLQVKNNYDPKNGGFSASPKFPHASTLNTLMLMITPEIITNFEKYHVCDTKSSLTGIEEHAAIFKAIKEKNPTEVREKMKLHFKNLYEYCYNV